MNKVIALLTMILFVPGCALFHSKPVEPIQVEKRVQSIPVFHPPLPEAITWQEVEWKVLTPETMQQYLDDLKAGKAPSTAFYAVTPETYRALSENIADIQRFINQSNALLMYYRKNLHDIVVEQVETKPATPETK